MNTNQNPWISTFSGQKFFYVNPDHSQILIEDVAHALSLINRFSGHTKWPRSVAQHSVDVCDLLLSHGHTNSDAFCGLMHDGPEAYIQDLSKPLKTILPDYKKIEDEIWLAFSNKFGLPVNIPPIVKWADCVLLVKEASKYLENPNFKDWEFPWGRYDIFGFEASGPVDAKTAEDQFLDRFSKLA